MKPKTEALAKRIANESILDQFLLVGGTALSLHLEHRLSEDLDFATSSPTLPTGALSDLLKWLESEGCDIQDATSLATHHYFINAGLDIENYQQDWLIDGVKLTFFTMDSDNGREKLASDSGIEWNNRLRLASLDTLFVTKSLLLTDRHTIRDNFDMYVLFSQADYSYGDLVNAYKVYRPGASLEIVNRRLVDTDYPLTDPGLQGLTGEPESEIIQNIHLFFTLVLDKNGPPNASHSRPDSNP